MRNFLNTIVIFCRKGYRLNNYKNYRIFDFVEKNKNKQKLRIINIYVDLIILIKKIVLILALLTCIFFKKW